MLRKNTQSNKSFNYYFYLTGLLWLFGLFINSNPPFNFIAFASLVTFSILVSIILNRSSPELLLKQFWKVTPNQYQLIGFAGFLSAILSILYRQNIGLSLLPEYVEYFVIISCAIGITEELLFRGLIQSEAARWNPKLAIFFGALAHAGYKASLFVLSQEPIDISILKLFAVTFLAGILLGLTRYKSNSLWPALIGHALFDLLVYAEQPQALWWVW